MAKLPQHKYIQSRDVARPVRDSVQQIHEALNRTLTVAQNMAADVVTVTTTTDEEFDITTSYPVKPAWVSLVDVRDENGNAVVLAAAPWVNWQYDTGRIRVSSVVGLNPGVLYTLKFWVSGG